MGGSFKGSGLIITCMEWEYTNGQMGGDMKENTLKIKSMATDFTSGQMGESTLVGGQRVNRMG